jgi:peptidoglycan/xylan/chitin deacetylase (PgdA/CDA1 family)
MPSRARLLGLSWAGMSVALQRWKAGNVVFMVDDRRPKLGKRERLVEVLDRTGVIRSVMQLRRLAPMPIVGVVTFHHIHDTAGCGAVYPYDPDVADATPRQFRRHLETVARIGTPVSMAELLRGIDGGPLPPNPLMITFDDGYRSCHDVALPILRELGIPATFFIATAFVGERRLYWWERIALALSAARRPRAALAYPRPIEIDARDPGVRRMLNDLVKNTWGLDTERFLRELCLALEVDWSPAIEAAHADQLIMTWDQVRALSRAGMAVESHTRHHPVLDTLDDATLRDELVGSRTDLERELGRPVEAIAYPVGRRIQQARIRAAVAAAGYRVGFANTGGVNPLWPASLRGALGIDLLDLRRISTDRTTSDAMFLAQLAIPALGY